MKADAKKLLNEFIASTQGVQYVIPVYQRNYTWKKKHVNRLIQDINDLLIGKTQSHFIGSIVYIITSEVFNQREWSIVDGQQRLTTIFLLLYAIRDILERNGDIQKAQALRTQYLENVNAQGDYKLRLKPLVNNDSEFKKIVEKDKDNYDKSTLIYQNYSIMYKQVEEWLKNYSIEEIIDAINKLYVVYIQLDKDDNAQQIFESINSTGETLKASDLIRNYILMNKTDQVQTKYFKNYWTVIEQNLDNDAGKLEEFFRFYITIKNFDLVNKNDLYEQFIEFWNKETAKQTEELVLNEIVAYSKCYNQLYLGGTVLGAEKVISVLKKIKSNMPAPLLMEMLMWYNNELISIEQLSDCIKLVNSYLIRRHMCDLNTSSITRLFPVILKSIVKTCNGKYDNVEDVLKFYLVNHNKNKSSYMPTDAEVKDYLSKKNAYVLSHTRTFFEIVEMESPIEINFKNLTVEHVMPQTSTEYWLKCCGVNPDQYENLVNLIGNLTLADKGTNSKIGNQDFETKKIELEKVGKINLSKDIPDKKVWTKDEIKNRTSVLIDKFIEIFPYFASANNFEEANSFPIYFQKGDVVAKALIYQNKEVELLAGSQLRICNNRDIASEEKLNELIEEKIVVEENGVYILNQSLMFNSISTVSNFVYGGSNNGWIQWKDDEGNVLDQTIRVLLNEK